MPQRGETTREYDLRAKVREIPRQSAEDDPVARAEAALVILSRHFDDWMEDEVSKIAATRDDWAATGLAPGEPREVFFRAVHDVKGQATTLGFPLATRAAASLCMLLERMDPARAPPQSLIDSHVEAIRAIFRERAKDASDKLGNALVSALDGVTKAFVAEHGLPETSDDGSIL